MKEFDVWYGKMVIDTVWAETERKALNLARKLWQGGEQGQVTVKARTA